MNQQWQLLHKSIIVDFLQFLNSKTNRFILKDGTSLMMCYGLTRFSEDIDLDSTDSQFFKYIDLFIQAFSSKYNGLTYRKGKDTDTVKRAFIHYGGAKPLKIEVSYRRKAINSSECCIINGIVVYTIENIMMMKIGAFQGRDKIRDLYDIVFIYTSYKKCLSNQIIYSLRNAVEYKGLEQVDYLIRNQSDPLIDNNALVDGFLNMYFDLGLR